MKKALNFLSVMIVMLIILFSFSIAALAKITSQDGLQVNFTTDKQSYSLNEDIQITLSVMNTNDFTVKDVSIEALLPDKFELKDSNDETSTKAIDLNSGEQANLTVAVVVKDEEQNVTNTTDNTQDTKRNTQTITNFISNNDNNKSDKLDGNTNNNSNQDKISIKTGSDFTYISIFIVLLLASISTLLYCLINHFDKTTKIVLSVLFVVISVTSVIGSSTFNAFSQENRADINRITLTLSESIKVDNKDYTVIANVHYSEVNSILNERKDAELNMKRGLLSDGLVKESTTNNPIKDVRVDVIDNLSDSLDPVVTTTTDENGSFSLTLPYGSYSLSFHHDNYNYYGTSLDVDSEYVILQNPILLNPLKEENYKEAFINALLENEDIWYYNNGAGFGYQSGLTFTDLNFDGKPEFIMQYGGGSMRNNDASAYYLSNNKLCKADMLFQNNLTGYYDKSNNCYVILGNAYAKGGVDYICCGNFELSFDGNNIESDYFSSYIAEDINYTGNFMYTYFNGANGYGDVNGLSKITETEYNKINEEKLKNLVNINMKREYIFCSDWEKYSASEKRQALEKVYDSFTYDKY